MRSKLLFFILILFSSSSLLGSSFKYKVAYVLDGDTFTATDGNVTFRVRIAAMDAPEKAQDYGRMAKYRLEGMLKSKEVTVQPVAKGYDKYGRVLGHVFLDKEDIALLMIQEGLATYYRPTCKDYPADKKRYDYDPTIYIEAENTAKSSQKNIWSHPNMELPCQYRHRQD